MGRRLGAPNRTHGLSFSPEYFTYQNARQRCTNPKAMKYNNYGGRGIKFLFTSFEQFLADVGPRPSPQHSLDRKRNEGHYEPGNVKWSTKQEQAANKRWPVCLENYTTDALVAELKRRGVVV